MKKSIKKSICLLNIGLVVIVFITTLILYNNNIITANFLSVPNLIVIIAFVLVATVLSTIVSNMITFPLKKMEKGMKSVSAGKFVDIRHLKDYTNFYELQDLADSYTAMM